MNNFLDEVGKIAGAIAAEQGVTKLDPNANFLEKTAAAVAGYEGAKIAEEKFDEYRNEQTDNIADSQSNLDNQDNQDL